MDQTTLDMINEWLKLVGGQRADGAPFFRIVFSVDQREKRRGEFSDYIAGNVLIRRRVEVREVPKYGYLKPCYILEKWVPPGVCAQNPELAEPWLGSYEPIWTFLKKDGEPIDPSLYSVQFIIHQLFNPQHLTPEQHRDMLLAEQEKEVSQLEDMIDIRDKFKVQVGYEKGMKDASHQGNVD